MISVIIPVKNEEENLKRLLPLLISLPEVEVITVDGLSEDCSFKIAQQYLQENALIAKTANRATQLNQGAEFAKGSILLFLHADSILPEGWAVEVAKLLQNKAVIAGAFRFKVNGKGLGFRILEFAVYLRCFFKKLPYGDQGIFITREHFLSIKGFPQLPIMEDYLFIERVKQMGTLALSPLPLITSSRRWDKLGIMQTTIRNQKIIRHFKKRNNLKGMRDYYDL